MSAAGASAQDQDRSALARRIAALPVPPPASAQDRLRSWLGEIDAPVVVQLEAIWRATPHARDLVAHVAELSPHLWDLVRADPARLARILSCEPGERLERILAETLKAVAASTDEAEASRLLRLMKAESSLLIALCDIGEVWPVMRVTRALTELADCAVRAAVNFQLADATRRGKLKPADPSRPEEGSGYFVLAMGKMGAFELNYSSDIDLIVFFDPQAPALAPGTEPSSLHIRVTRGLVKLLQERTPEGYVFRVDLRLRPDPASTHIAISTPAALEYYERRGQNWERSAMIKARPCAGDIAAGERFLSELSAFVWRKYMDFAALSDVHAMKRQIHAYRGHGEIAVAGHNIKLGRGGIREIEFFAQTQQLIAGGRNPDLRDRATLPTLRALAAGGWIGADAARELEDAYLFLRRVEHRLQMVADEQTHTLPSDPEPLECLARFLGFADIAAFSEVLVGHLRRVQAHYSKLFEKAPDTREGMAFPAEADDPDTLERLTALGFRHAGEVSRRVRLWISGKHASLRGAAAREQLEALLPDLLEQIARSLEPDAALVAVDRFLANLHGAGRVLSLLRQHADVLALILLILGNAPRLGDILAQHSQVLDALVDPAFFGALPDAGKLSAELSRSLAQSTTYEDFLDRLRLFGQEHMFLIGARILSGTVSADLAGDAYARLAEVIIGALHRATEERFAEAHGRIPGQATAVVAMGKLGGREMTATSDLDLLLIYDFDEANPQSDGARPLYGAQYFARLTQRLISALTAQTNYGALYQVDMRLRPSGRSGPVATKIDSFESYQKDDAWTWEHMALTRARVVCATPGFGERVEAVIGDVLCRPRDAVLIADDAFEMRRAIAREKGESERWDLKYAVGGLIDTEFVAQYLQLAHAADHPGVLDTSTARALDKAAKLGLLAPEDIDALRPATRLYQDLSQILRLCLSGPLDPKKAGAGLIGLLVRAGDVPDFAALEAHLAETQEQVRASFSRILGEKS